MMASEIKKTPTHRPATKRKKGADKAQFERFVATARESGVDESPDTLDHAFKRIAGAGKAPKPVAASGDTQRKKDD